MVILLPFSSQLLPFFPWRSASRTFSIKRWRLCEWEWFRGFFSTGWLNWICICYTRYRRGRRSTTVTRCTYNWRGKWYCTLIVNLSSRCWLDTGWLDRWRDNINWVDRGRFLTSNTTATTTSLTTLRSHQLYFHTRRDRPCRFTDSFSWRTGRWYSIDISSRSSSGSTRHGLHKIPK